MRRRRASCAAAVLARALQRAGLAAAAHPAFDAGLARIRRPAAGERLGRESAGQGMGRRHDAARARAGHQHSPQQVSRRARAARQQPLRPAAEPEAIRANLDLEIDESTQVEGEALVDRRTGNLLGRHSPGTSRARPRRSRCCRCWCRKSTGHRAARRQGGAGRHAGRAEVQWRHPHSRRRDRAVPHQPQDDGLQPDGRFSGDELEFDARGDTARASSPSMAGSPGRRAS